MLEEEKETKFEFEDQLFTDFAYYRVECHTLDGKRAYSNPIRTLNEAIKDEVKRNTAGIR